jgi:hypothetical protein
LMLYMNIQDFWFKITPITISVNPTPSDNRQPQLVDCLLGNEFNSIGGSWSLTKLGSTSNFVYMDATRLDDITYNNSQKGNFIYLNYSERFQMRSVYV